MNNLEDIRRKLYDLELYYAQVESWPDGIDKELKLMEIHASIIDYEMAIYNIESNNMIRLFEYTLYGFGLLAVVIAVYFILMSFI